MESNELKDILTGVGLLSCQIVILFSSIVVHEVSHGYMACRLGDPTAKNMGRLTLNPLPHIDLVGSLLFFTTLILRIFNLFPIPIGYAKPVMVDFRYFKDPLKGMAKVAASGPASNLIMASLFFLGHSALIRLFPSVPDEIRLLVVFGIFINVLLALFNLLPIPPLDGSNILAGFLPFRYTLYFARFQRFGIAFILILILFIGEERLITFVKSFYGLFDIRFD